MTHVPRHVVGGKEPVSTLSYTGSVCLQTATHSRQVELTLQTVGLSTISVNSMLTAFDTCIN